MRNGAVPARASLLLCVTPDVVVCAPARRLLTKPASDTTAIKGGHLTRCLSMLLLHSPRLPEHPALAAHAPASMRGTTQHMSPSRRAWGAEKEEAGDGRGLGGREVEAAPDPRFWLRSRQAKFRSSSSRSSSNMEQAATDLVAAICGRMQAGLADMSTDEVGAGVDGVLLGLCCYGVGCGGRDHLVKRVLRVCLRTHMWASPAAPFVGWSQTISTPHGVMLACSWWSCWRWCRGAQAPALGRGCLWR